MMERLKVSDHYARGNLIDAIREGVTALGKTNSTVTVEDLRRSTSFISAGGIATEELVAQLHLTAADHVLDIGCGLGGAARLIAEQYGCRVTGIDLTRDYVEAGQTCASGSAGRPRVAASGRRASHSVSRGEFHARPICCTPA